MIHIYFGDGKGKTSAAFGLALRALGRGLSVDVYQFLKGSLSGEVLALDSFEKARSFRIPTPENHFVWNLTPEERADYFQKQRQLFQFAQDSILSKAADVVILDEVFTANQMGVMEEEALLELMRSCDASIELIMTGHDKPGKAFQCEADYVTRMEKLQHPYDRGVLARPGIEY